MLLTLLACAPADTFQDSAALDSAEALPRDGSEATSFDCGPYAPQARAGLAFPEVSSLARYRVSDPEMGEGWMRTEVRGERTWKGQRGWVNVEIGDSLDDEGLRHHWEISSFHLCDAEGLKLHSVESTFTLSTPAGDRTQQVTRTFDPPPLVYPRDLGVGASWAYETTVHERHADGSTVDLPIHAVRTITDKRQETVQAGTFPTLHLIEEHDDGAVAEFDLAADVGAVRTPTTELITFHRYDGI